MKAEKSNLTKEAVSNPVNPKINLSDPELEMLHKIRDAIEMFEAYSHDIVQLSDRNQMKGAGIRRYGFIEATCDISAVNSEYQPGFFNWDNLHRAVHQIEFGRVLLLETQKLARIVSESLLTSGDNGYSLALIYYNAVREAARPSANMPGARVIFERLRTFFSSPRRRRSSDEPTEIEALRDVKALLHGRKDGEIIVKNQRPVVSKGNRIIVDETHKDKAAFKETEEGEING